MLFNPQISGNCRFDIGRPLDRLELLFDQLLVSNARHFAMLLTKPGRFGSFGCSADEIRAIPRPSVGRGQPESCSVF